MYDDGYDDIDREVTRLRRKLTDIGRLLEDNGCDCQCSYVHTEHDDDCDRCLACRIEAVLKEDK